MNNNILLATTKSITINIFLNSFIIESIKKKYNLSILTSDTCNIDKNIINLLKNENLFKFKSKQIFRNI